MNIIFAIATGIMFALGTFQLLRSDMVKSAMEFPGYGFEVHKGYGTSEHGKVIEASGLCPIHRKSFCGKYLHKSTL